MLKLLRDGICNSALTQNQNLFPKYKYKEICEYLKRNIYNKTPPGFEKVFLRRILQCNGLMLNRFILSIKQKLLK